MGANTRSSAWSYAAAELVGDRLARLLGSHLAQSPRRAAAVVGGPLGRIGLGRDARVERRLELLPNARHAAEERRMGVGHVGEYLGRVRAARDRVTPHHVPVMVEATVGDVGRVAGTRSPNRPARGRPIASMPRHCAISLACVSCTPLGGPVVPDV